MKINIHKESQIDLTHRVEMLGSMFEIPISDKLSISLEGEIDIESKDWNVGLIVGPSGSGKTLLLENLFGKSPKLEFRQRSVIDDFPSGVSMETIASVCASVGFNTIPAWLRPFDVLSNGEKFRCEIAARLLSSANPILVDEFTSVVDRQVAQITSYAVQKHVRGSNRRFVGASCHYDIIEWLDPDWILEPGNPCKLTWRSLRRSRPSIRVSVSRAKYETWHLFAPFHYMSRELNKAARCYGLFVEATGSGDSRCEEGFSGSQTGLRAAGCDPQTLREISHSSEREEEGSSIRSRIASFCGILHRPHPRVSDILGFTRMVTLPDFQGLGLAMCLASTVGSAYRALGKRLHSYPNHPSWIRSYQRSPLWMPVKQAGVFSPKRGETSSVGGFGGRRCAVFAFIGEPMNREDAERLVSGE